MRAKKGADAEMDDARRHGTAVVGRPRDRVGQGRQGVLAQTHGEGLNAVGRPGSSPVFGIGSPPGGRSRCAPGLPSTVPSCRGDTTVWCQPSASSWQNEDAGSRVFRPIRPRPVYALRHRPYDRTDGDVSMRHRFSLSMAAGPGPVVARCGHRRRLERGPSPVRSVRRTHLCPSVRPAADLFLSGEHRSGRLGALKAEPWIGSQRLTKVYDGTLFLVIGAVPGWKLVRFKSGEQGWIAERLVGCCRPASH